MPSKIEKDSMFSSLEFQKSSVQISIFHLFETFYFSIFRGLGDFLKEKLVVC